jgi:hypothetical protein
VPKNKDYLKLLFIAFTNTYKHSTFANDISIKIIETDEILTHTILTTFDNNSDWTLEWKIRSKLTPLRQSKMTPSARANRPPLAEVS